MDTTDQRDSLAQEQRAATLRAELKQWEKNFAAANDGRKASRDEIKNDLEIAARYKEYNRLKDILSGKAILAEETRRHAPHKRKSHEGNERDGLQEPATPSKRRRVKQKFTTPQRNEKKAPRPGQIEILEDEAVVEEAGTPVPRKLYVGPTPQKNGRALGLFDLLSPVKSEDFDPKKGATGYNAAAAPTASSPRDRAALEPVAVNRPAGVPSTPSRLHASSTRATGVTPQKRKLEEEKDADDDSDDEARYVRRHSRTPQSVGRRFWLSTFVPTPSRYSQENSSLEKNVFATPSKPRSLDSAGPATPAYLRRDNSQLQESSLTSPSSTQWLAPTRRLNFFGFGKKSSSRSLSSMIADIRKAEDEKLDEQLDLLREIEGGAEAVTSSATRKGNRATTSAPVRPDEQTQPHVLDSIEEENEDEGEHEQEGKLGPDGEHEEQAERSAMSANEPHILPDGRVWKKKGLRRQTRRVLLRPQAPGKAAPIDVQSKPLLYGGGTAEDEVESGETQIMPETLLNQQSEHTGQSKKKKSEHGPASDESDDDEDSDNGDEDGKDENYRDINTAGDDVESTAAAHTRKRRKLTKAPPKQKIKKAAKDKEEGVVKKTARKISATATAHANFCRLKIKSKNSGPKGGKGGRFGGARRR